MERDADGDLDAQLKAFNSRFGRISRAVNAVLRETRRPCGIYHSDAGIEGVWRLKHHEATCRADHEGPINLRISDVVHGQAVEFAEHAILGSRLERKGTLRRQRR